MQQHIQAEHSEAESSAFCRERAACGECRGRGRQHRHRGFAHEQYERHHRIPVRLQYAGATGVCGRQLCTILSQDGPPDGCFDEGKDAACTCFLTQRFAVYGQRRCGSHFQGKVERQVRHFAWSRESYADGKHKGKAHGCVVGQI